jgi:hypothetical protein
MLRNLKPKKNGNVFEITSGTEQVIFHQPPIISSWWRENAETPFGCANANAATIFGRANANAATTKNEILQERH